MNRRNFLKVFGVMAAAPSLLVKEAALTPRLDPNIIQTGFKAIDSAMLGQGLQRGEIMSFIGHSGVGKSTIAKSIALNASKQATVALIQDELPLQNKGCAENQNGNLSIFEHFDLKNIEHVLENHDLVIVDRDFMYGECQQFVANVLSLSAKHQTRLILSLPATRSRIINGDSTFGSPLGLPAYVSNYIIKLDEINIVNCIKMGRAVLRTDLLLPNCQFINYVTKTLQITKNRYSSEKLLWSPIWLKHNRTFTDKYFDWKETQKRNSHLSCFNYENQ